MLQSITRKARWWEVALLTVAVTVLSRLFTGDPRKKNERYYEKETRQPAWAPPGWMFAPAWTINNIFLLIALIRLLRQPWLKHRQSLLALQAGIWAVFFSFGYFYFRKRSTLLGGALTVADAKLALFSFVLALKTDKRLAGNYLPLVLWTLFASTLAIPQALWNDDRFFGTKALLPAEC